MPASQPLPPSPADALWSEASAHFGRGAYAHASHALREALRLDPGNPARFHDLGVSLKREGRLAEAEAMLREALRRDPRFAQTALSLADLLRVEGRTAEAQTIYRDFLVHTPGNFDVVREFSNTLLMVGHVTQALEHLDAFIRQFGRSPEALDQQCVLLLCAERLDEAFDAAVAVIRLQAPTALDTRLANYVSLAGRLGRLDHRADATDLMRAAIDACLPAGQPAKWATNELSALRRFAYLFPYFAIDDRVLMRAIGAVGVSIDRRTPHLAPRVANTDRYKLRVGYISANFSEHPIGHLLSPFFEAHARTGTELYLYALHLNKFDPSDYAGRIRATTPHYRDCRGRTAVQVAASIRADEVDILVDLDGYLDKGQPEVLAMRPAPVQMHWLQHLAGMPAPFIDYTIVDHVLVRDDERHNGNGAVVRLAGAFQCGDRVPLAPGAPPRAEHGLPDDVMVFCAFCNWLKIDEEVFGCWLDILEAVPGSVLWLSEGPVAQSKSYLRARLDERGISGERLVFAPRVASKAQHLHRHRCADLFLDTFTFSGGTSAADALWAGLPLLTRPGTTAQSRLAASQLQATGFTRTIVRTNEAYVEEAIRLARNPRELAALKAELAERLPQASLYDAEQLATQLGTVYSVVWERFRRGERPAHIDMPTRG